MPLSRAALVRQRPLSVSGVVSHANSASISTGSAAAGATLITTTLSGGGTVVISSTRFANPTVTVVSNGGVTSYHPQYFLYSVSFLLFGICVREFATFSSHLY